MPFFVFSVSVNANITGNKNVGKFIGRNRYCIQVLGYLFKQIIQSIGSNQDNFGGFYGYASYYGNIHRFYSDMTISSSANRVDSAVGYIDYWNSSYIFWFFFISKHWQI